MPSRMAQLRFDAERGNAQDVCLVMIETVAAVANLDAILDVPGVDGVFVGPRDLTISHAGTEAQAGTSPCDVEMIETPLALPAGATLIAQGMAAVLAEARQGGGAGA
jgi:2-keto-3-deoxy-L-rhamnonate aldolase RhmA